MAILKNTTVNDTGFLQLPAGTTAQRPSVANGRLRFNSTTGKVEFYNASVATWLGTTTTGVVAIGGTVYDVDVEGTTYRVHVFTTTGNSTFTVTKGGSVEYLIVAGGGGGSGNFYDDGGGGGGGGLITGTTTVTTQSYTVIVGGGGARSTGGAGGNGGNSSFLGLTALGGGGGGSHRSPGIAGGSGGGGLGSFVGDNRNVDGGSATQPGSASGGFGNKGGTGGLNGVVVNGGGYPASGGGGGASEPGRFPLGTNAGQGGQGGAGLNVNISGIQVFYAGGGGGVRVGKGGLGGGGTASIGRGSTPAENGVSNSGGGGGGGRASSGETGIPGIGGSGIVIIRYPLRQENPTTAAGKVIGDGLVLDLDFGKPTVYAGSDTVVTDSRLNGITGTLVNGPVFTDPRTHRSSFRFQSSGTYIQLPSSLEQQLNGRPEASLNMWIKLDSGSNSAGNAGIIQLSGHTNSNGNLYYYTDAGNVGGIWLDIFRTDRVTTGDRQPTFDGTLWHLLTVTTTPGTNGWKMYLNGILRFQTTGQSTVAANASLFGGFRIAQNSGSRQLLGNIGKVSIYNTALSSTQVTEYFNATRWRFGV